VGSGRLERTEPIAFGYEYTDVGRDSQSPVTDDYPRGANAFTGTLTFLELQSGADTHDHLIDPGQLLHFMLGKQ
jgi:arylsulfatase